MAILSNKRTHGIHRIWHYVRSWVRLLGQQNLLESRWGRRVIRQIYREEKT